MNKKTFFLGSLLLPFLANADNYGVWKTSDYEASKLYDQPNLYAMTASEESYDGDPAFLLIQCKDGRFRTGIAYNFKWNRSGYVNVRYRIDSGVAREGKLYATENDEILYVTTQTFQAHDLLKKNKLYIQLDVPGMAPYGATFGFKNFDSIFQLFSKTNCKKYIADVNKMQSR